MTRYLVSADPRINPAPYELHLVSPGESVTETVSLTPTEG
jgi:hypothetical protein